jgi:hypothetical protein
MFLDKKLFEKNFDRSPENWSQILLQPGNNERRLHIRRGKGYT